MTDQNLYESDNDYYAISEILPWLGTPKWPFGRMLVGHTVRIPDPANHDNATAAYKYAAKKYAIAFKRKTIDGVLHIERIA